MKKLVLFLLLGTLSQVASAQAWVRQASGFSPVSSGVRNVAAVDANIVWISSYDGSSATPANRRDFSRTTNGGATWTAGTIAAPKGMHRATHERLLQEMQFVLGSSWELTHTEKC